MNGTSGYEEAAAQGLVAGINAAQHAAHKAPLTFTRSDGYIGVSISASSNMVDHKATMMLLISEKILSVLFIQARSIKTYCSEKDII